MSIHGESGRVVVFRGDGSVLLEGPELLDLEWAFVNVLHRRGYPPGVASLLGAEAAREAFARAGDCGVGGSPHCSYSFADRMGTRVYRVYPTSFHGFCCRLTLPAVELPRPYRRVVLGLVEELAGVVPGSASTNGVSAS